MKTETSFRQRMKPNIVILVKFEVFTEVLMKIMACWIVELQNLLEWRERFAENFPFST